MIILTVYTIGLVLWFVCVMLQRNIIAQQEKIIDEQNLMIAKLRHNLKTKTMLYRVCKHALGIRKVKNKEEEKCSE